MTLFYSVIREPFAASCCNFEFKEIEKDLKDRNVPLYPMGKRTIVIWETADCAEKTAEICGTVVVNIHVLRVLLTLYWPSALYAHKFVRNVHLFVYAQIKR